MNNFAAIDFETANYQRVQRKTQNTTIQPFKLIKYSPLKIRTINNITQIFIQIFTQIVPSSQIVTIFAEISRL